MDLMIHKYRKNEPSYNHQSILQLSGFCHICFSDLPAIFFVFSFLFLRHLKKIQTSFYFILILQQASLKHVTILLYNHNAIIIWLCTAPYHLVKSHKEISPNARKCCSFRSGLFESRSIQGPLITFGFYAR